MCIRLLSGQLIHVDLIRRLFYKELEEHKLSANYAAAVNYNFHHMCVRKVARTHVAHHCGEQLLPDASEWE